MAKRRTKKEKITASKRRVLFNYDVGGIQDKDKKSEILSVANKKDFYTPNISLPINLVVSDLTKSGVVTILALIFQFSLSKYLDMGGWKLINEMLYKVFSNY